MRILVVDDEPTVGEVILSGLRRSNMEVVLALSAGEALEILTNEEIDLLVTDLIMPDMTGIELVGKLRQNARYRDLPVLMISGRADRKDIIAANELGVLGFVAKPFKPDELHRRIRSVFQERRRLLREQQVQAIWDRRQTSFNDIFTPQIVFGEPLSKIKDLWKPENRRLVTYLNNAREAIDALNQANERLDMGYVIEDNTVDIILPMVRHAAKKWIKLILLSTRCPGKPLLLVRLFTINRGSDMPIFLIYDHRDEFSDEERQNLKKMGVKLLKRGNLDKDRLKRLFDRHVVRKIRPRTKVPTPTLPTPDELRERLIEDLESMTTLPPLPLVYQRILELSRDPESDLKEWIQIIRMDPMTCAVILRHTNTLEYGFKGRIAEIDRAIVLLGKNAVAALVASEGMRQAFTDVQEQGFDLEDFWLHSLAVGFAAYILSFPLSSDTEYPAQERSFAALDLEDEVVDRLREIDLPGRLRLDYSRENPFVGGIMHDLGKGVMVHSYPGLFPLLLEELKARDWGVPMSFVEQELAGGLTHPIVGEILARSWSLDDEICDVILHHHFPEIDETFAFLIGISDIIGQALYPFPRGARFPVGPALEEGKIDSVASFLPEGFCENPLLSVEEFTTLAAAITPKVRHYTERMRQSVRP